MGNLWVLLTTHLAAVPQQINIQPLTTAVLCCFVLFCIFSHKYMIEVVACAVGYQQMLPLLRQTASRYSSAGCFAQKVLIVYVTGTIRERSENNPTTPREHTLPLLRQTANRYSSSAACFAQQSTAVVAYVIGTFREHS